MSDTIAITGVSGRFPNAKNIDELQEALFAGVDLVSNTHDRWPSESLELPSRLGLINDFDRLDVDFFGINTKDAHALDPRMRKLLEVTYEAIVDAGLSPAKLRGKKVGVFLGIHSNEREDLNRKGDSLTHACTMFANVLSFYFDFKGPSFAIGSACATSFITLEIAMDNILSGKCDMAITCVAQSHFDPIESMELTTIGVMSPDGICKPFDCTRTGYSKSECVMSMVIQKVEESKRIYATISAIGNTCEGFRKEGLYFPTNSLLKKTYEDVYKKYNVDPLDVNYVETHATATIIGDSEELRALKEFYSKGRKTPVLIGSVKGNLGHTEVASGLVALLKVILAIREKTIPANLHFTKLDPELSKICEGTLEVVAKNTPLPDGLIAVNCYGLTGSIAIVVVRPFTANNTVINTRSHRLVQASGRTPQSVQLMLENVIKNKENEEFLALFDEVHSENIKNHKYRGYAVLSENSRYDIKQCPSKKRPVWFLYSGLESQMPGLVRELMKVETFRNTIQVCAEALKPYGIDLVDDVTNGIEKTLDNVVKTFTSVTAIAVSLTDVLTSLNIKPSGIIGHSVGEISCAYADGLITAKQAVLLAYNRGTTVAKSQVLHGATASISMSINDCLQILPEEMYIACDETNTNVTISGPEETVLKVIQNLKQQGVYSTEIKKVAYAFHCPEIATEVYNKPRSERWSSTTSPSTECSCYDVINIGRFKELLKNIPQDVIILEIAPKGVLERLLKAVLRSNSTTVLSFGKPGVDNINHFLTSVGELYNAGENLNLKEFYQSIKYPVSINTPMLSNLVTWNHKTKWDMLKYNPCGRFGTRMLIDLSHQNYQFLKGNVSTDEVVFPPSGYIVLVWQVFSKMIGRFYTHIPVVIEHLNILEPRLVLTDTETNITVNIFQVSGEFEIFLGNDQKPLLATGRIKTVSTVEDEFLDLPENLSSQKLKIGHDDFYYSMSLRGHHYNSAFKGFVEGDLEEASLKWENNWVTFLDSVIQYALFSEMTNYSHVTHIAKIVISPEDFAQCETNVTAHYHKNQKTVRCGGTELRYIQFNTPKKAVSEIEPTLKTYAFVPYNDTSEEVNSFEHTLNMAVQIVVENSENMNINVALLSSDNSISFIHSATKKTIEIHQISSSDEAADLEFDLMVVLDTEDEDVCDLLENSKFVFTQTDNDLTDTEIIYQHGDYVLLRKPYDIPTDHKIITIDSNCNEWIETVNRIKSSTSRIYLVSEEINSEMIDLLEEDCSNLRFFVIRNYQIVEPFSLTSPFYAPQINKDLVVNVYIDTWGTYKNLSLQKHQVQPSLNFQLLRYGDDVKWTQKSSFSTTENIQVQIAGLRNDTTEVEEDDTCLGLEYSGVDAEGNKVMGLVENGALSNSVQSHPQLTWNFSKLSFEEAATIPLAYAMAYYALHIRNDISKKTVLIHNICDDFSLAAAVLSFQECSDVFIITSKDSDLDVVNNNLPLLTKCKIIEHTNHNHFCKTVMKQTNGEGVDIVINCNSDKLFKLSQKCSHRNASFIEINNNDNLQIKENSSFIHCINIKDIFELSSHTKAKIASALEIYINQGLIVPLQRPIFDKNQIEIASKFVEDNKNGCLITIEDTSEVFSVSRTYFDPSKIYIIVGGLGKFGFELAKWMVDRGATKLMLNHPNDLSSGYHALTIQKLQKTILTNSIDATTSTGAESLINLALQTAPIGGIFNTTCVDDCYELTQATTTVKNTDIVSRKACKNLDYFVVVSSLSYNHRRINPTIMSLCRARKEDQLSGLLVKFGPIAEMENNIEDHVSEQKSQTLASCLGAIDRCLQQNEAVVASFIEDKSEEENREEETFVHKIADVFGFKKISDIDKNKTLFDLGINSMMIWEITNILLNDAGVELSYDIVRNLTFEDIIKMV